MFVYNLVAVSGMDSLGPVIVRINLLIRTIMNVSSDP